MTVMGGYIERLRIPDGYRCFGAKEVFGRITGDELSEMTSWVAFCWSIQQNLHCYSIFMRDYVLDVMRQVGWQI